MDQKEQEQDKVCRKLLLNEVHFAARYNIDLGLIKGNRNTVLYLQSSDGYKNKRCRQFLRMLWTPGWKKRTNKERRDHGS